jgi:hypothetical protein
VRRLLALSCVSFACAVAGGARAWNEPTLCARPELVATLVCDASEAAPTETFAECSLDQPDPVFFAGGAETQNEQSASADLDAARAAMKQAHALLAAGKRGDALLQLRIVERLMPSVADRFALRRGELALELGMPEQACEAYGLAALSPDRSVAARAQIGSVHCLLRAGDRKGERAFEALLRRYPKLPLRHQLDYELAMARQGWGALRSAVELLRRIDLEDPASDAAQNAREQLAQLSQRGVRVAPYSAAERVGRAERLIFDAPLEQAATEVEALRQDRGLNAELRNKLQQLAARIARIQGRFDKLGEDSHRVQTARAGQPVAAVAEDPELAERLAAERRIRTLRGSKPIARLNSAQLRSVFELAVSHGLQPECDEALDAMRTRRAIDPASRFNAAIRASGVANDDKIAALLETLLDAPHYRVSARYHYARALERLGHMAEAQAEYQRVIAADRGQTQYYAIWADLRLWTLQSQSREGCVPPTAGAAPRCGLRTEEGRPEPGALALPAVDRDDGSAGVAVQQVLAEPHERDAGLMAAKPDDALASASEAPSPGFSLLGAVFDHGAPVPARHDRRAASSARAVAKPAEQPDRPERLGEPGRSPAVTATPRQTSAAALRGQVLELLRPLARSYGEAYPWLPRAEALTELELFDEAADEVNEAFLAFRDATGALRLRSGLLALLTGNAPPRRSVSYTLGKARRALDRPARSTLSDVANLLGDPGVGVRFGSGRFDSRPRAYAPLVERAAHRHGLDPNLLFAVMRVESIYNRRIISNAGAVGLMQIMPATGERIARQLGVDDFDATELLDPARNLDFSAWYLASLLQRFDGRLPLAIASYNGGPHNVRIWLHASPARMPLDAFLERIPFSQTHEYVRRVLAYYAQYRAQQNLPMTRLSVELPAPRPDPLAF